MYKYGKHVAQEKHDTVRNVIVPHVELRFSPVLFWEFRLIRELRLIFHGVGSSAVLASAAMSRQIRRTRHGTALLSSCRYRLAALGQRLERRSVTERYPWPKPKARATRVHCHLWYNTGSSATGHCWIRRLVRDLTVCSCHRDVPLYSDTFSTFWPRNSSENVFYYKTIVNSTNFNDVSNVLFPACLSDIKISNLRLGLQSRFPGSVIILVSFFAIQQWYYSVSWDPRFSIRTRLMEWVWGAVRFWQLGFKEDTRSVGWATHHRVHWRLSRFCGS